MKKKFFLIKICLVFIAVACFTACNEKIEDASNRDSKGVSVFPNPMTIGEPVTISGPGFGNATAIEFPGGVTVTEFTKAGDFQITMTVPGGTNNTGNITVILPDGSFVIPLEVTIVDASVNIATAMDINPENGLYWVGPNDKLTIRGEGLGAVQAIILPGGVTLDAMNLMKSESSIEITIPNGVEKTIAKVQINLHDGRTLLTANEVDFSGEGYVPVELLPFCGRSFKVWLWDEEQDFPFGNGGYGSSLGPDPAWWRISYAGLDGQFGRDGVGAKMEFRLPNIMTKTLNDGTVLKGKFKVDNTLGVDKWSTGKLFITAGDEELSIVGGTYNNYNGSYNLYPKVFDIIKLTNAEMVLAFQYPEETATANFYMFRVSEDEGEGSTGSVNVPNELKIWVGSGSKTWTWNDEFEGNGFYYGKGDGHYEVSPTWWTAKKDPSLFIAGEGEGAKMILSYQGKGTETLTKMKTDGSKVSGSFAVDMEARYPGWSRAIGKFSTDGVTILSGQGIDGRKDCFEYWILDITETEMLLGNPEVAEDWSYDEKTWGQATMWLFKAVETE